MQLAPNFTLDELTTTQRRELLDENRRGAREHLTELRVLAYGLLQPIRDRFGPVVISSGFRCPALNAAIGGSIRSQHMRGEAADLVVPGVDLDSVFDWIWRSDLRFGQLIREGRSNGSQWIHLSLGYPYRDRSRSGQVLRMQDDQWQTLATGVNQ